MFNTHSVLSSLDFAVSHFPILSRLKIEVVKNTHGSSGNGLKAEGSVSGSNRELDISQQVNVQ